MGPCMLNPYFIVLALVLPSMLALLHGRARDQKVFLYNAGKWSLAEMVLSIVCGNIGITTFLALILFTVESPVLGHAVALAYAAGLVICAAMAPRIHAAARTTGTYGFVDYLVAAHDIRHPILVWLPVAVVFSLRIIIQLLALGLMISASLGVGPAAAGLIAAGSVLLYLLWGGYRAATQTDVFQGGFILLGLAGLLLALIGAPSESASSGTVAFFSFGTYGPALLIGVAVFLPFSAVLSIDNWQRISTAASPTMARRAFAIAAVLCGTAYLIIVAATGRTGIAPGAGIPAVIGGLIDMMPHGMGWLTQLMLVAAMMSSVDTLVLPLAASLLRIADKTGGALWQSRLVVTVFIAVLAALGLWIADLLNTIIGAFNTLTIFLPATFGALLLGQRAPRAAVASVCGGVIVALTLSAVAVQLAAGIAFLFSLTVYVALLRRDQAAAI